MFNERQLRFINVEVLRPHLHQARRKFYNKNENTYLDNDYIGHCGDEDDTSAPELFLTRRASFFCAA